MTSEYGQNSENQNGESQNGNMPKWQKTVNDVTARTLNRILYCGHSTQYSHLVVICHSRKLIKLIDAACW